MELYGRKTFWSFLEEDQRCPPSPTSHHHHRSNKESEPRLSLSRPSSATVASLSPSSPGGSPWTLSPLRRSPSPSLLYHCIASLQRQDGNVYSIAISRGAVFTGSDSDRVRVWHQPDCIDRGYIRTHHGRVRAILAHGGTLFTSHKDHRVRVWSVFVAGPDRLRSKKLATLPPRGPSFFPFHRKKSNQHRDTISCLACYQAEGLLYTGSWDRTVKVWRLTEKACVDSFIAHEGQVSAMLVNQEDGCLFTSSTDGSVKLWRRVYGDSSHALTVVLRFQTSPVNALALSRSTSSCFLYSGSSDGYVNIWEKEAASGRFNHTGFLQGHRFAVLCLAAVERVVLSGSEDTTIRVWRREEGTGFHTCLAVIEGHRGPVRCLAVSLEVESEGVGLLLYSASLDRMVKVWRIKVVGKEREGEEGVEEEGEGEGKEVVFEMSPVLSPLWVEKKLQRSHHLY